MMAGEKMNVEVTKSSKGLQVYMGGGFSSLTPEQAENVAKIPQIERDVTNLKERLPQSGDVPTKEELSDVVADYFEKNPVSCSGVSKAMSESLLALVDCMAFDPHSEYATAIANFKSAWTGSGTDVPVNPPSEDEPIDPPSGGDEENPGEGGDTPPTEDEPTMAVNEQGYISDGLVHFYDGIQTTRDGDVKATTWEDLVGNVDFGGTTSTKKNATGGIKFAAGWIAEGVSTIADTEKATIEVCYKKFEEVTWGSVLFKSNAYYRNISLSTTGNIAIVTDNSTTAFNPNMDGMEITGISALYRSTGGEDCSLYVNGNEVTDRIATSKYNATANPCIGGNAKGSSSSYYPVHADIYSVRIYDRVLTPAEIAVNRANDLTRFGLE